MEKDSNKKGNSAYKTRNRNTSSLDETQIAFNAEVLNNELNWLATIVNIRVQEMISGGNNELPPAPILPNEKTSYGELIEEYKLTEKERLVLIVALAPQLRPELLTDELRDNERSIKILHPIYGGVIDQSSLHVYPTMQTVIYFLSGKDNLKQLHHQLYIRKSNLFTEQIIFLGSSYSSEDEDNYRNQLVKIAPEYTEYILSGEKPRLDFGSHFPAKHGSTNLSWDDLVVDEHCMDQINEVKAWMNHAKQMNSMAKIRPGFPCLFFGPPGTGKTLTATLLAKHYGKDVFKVDLSMIVSKYIGETEKNLAALFDRVENKDAILFFDEADALFTKRTGVSNSNDKWANLEMSYLLQRMEEYEGLTILATNMRNNLDSAMVRRFGAMIYFGRPAIPERAKLWDKLKPEGIVFEGKIAMPQLHKADVTGANITNIYKYCMAQILEHKLKHIDHALLFKALRRELSKENRTLKL
jgi:AAA+ superfamily predicted ATPase